MEVVLLLVETVDQVVVEEVILLLLVVQELLVRAMLVHQRPLGVVEVGVLEQQLQQLQELMVRLLLYQEVL